MDDLPDDERIRTALKRAQRAAAVAADAYACLLRHESEAVAAGGRRRPALSAVAFVQVP